MKKRLLVVFSAILATTILWWIGHKTLGGSIPVKDAISIYESAISGISNEEDITLFVTQSSNITIDDELFTTQSRKTIQYDRDSANTLRVSSHETLLSGSQEITIREILVDDQLFTEINNIGFISPITESGYLSGSIPPIIDRQLYKNISGIRTGGNYTLSFTEPKGLEHWVIDNMPENYTAEAKAYINQKGDLTGIMYHAAYSINNVSYNTIVKIDISQESVSISAPEYIANYTHIENPKALRALEIACGYLLQANNIAFDYTDNIYIQAMGDQRTQSVKGNVVTSDDWSATIETNITLTNDSRGDQGSQYAKTERFAEGKYTVSTNGENPIENAEITAIEMNSYIQNQLVSTIMLPQYIASAQIAESSGEITYTFGGNQDFAKYLAESACQILYQDSQLLDGAINTLSPKEFHCYLTVDKNTQIPTASGIIFTGDYTQSSVAYQIKYHAKQVYNISTLQ